MTKSLLAAVGLVALLLAAPSALAHGAPGVRSIDTRLLLDDDGLLAYGGCIQVTCLAEGGLDVLALDVREAHLPDGSPAIVFRMVQQSDAPAGSTLTLRLTASGSESTFTAATADGTTYTGTGFDRLDGPFDVGDGHPKALDGWVAYRTLGVQAGDTLSGIHLDSEHDSGAADLMPGGWTMQGQQVPVLSQAAMEGSAQPGEYTLRGPAVLLNLTVTPAKAQAPGQVTLRIANPTDLPQFVDLDLAVPPGASGSLDLDSVTLDANGARDVVLTLDGKSGAVFRITATSDLGAHLVGQVPIGSSASFAPPSNSTTTTPAAEPEGKDAPLPLLAPLALALAALGRSNRK
jgi:hypothetical protein